VRGVETVATMWRQANRSGHRGARAGVQQREGSRAGIGGRRRVESGRHEVDGGDCKAAARGGALSPASVRRQGSRRGAEEEEGRKKIQGPVCKF
jgi:hypothetical protein